MPNNAFPMTSRKTNMSPSRSKLLSLALLVAALGSSCKAPSAVVEMPCPKCRSFIDQELTVRRSGRHYSTTTRLPRQFECSNCGSVQLYPDGTGWAIRCPVCAPEGRRCGGDATDRKTLPGNEGHESR